MCTSPIKILNPKIRARLSTWCKDEEGIHIKVPCGKCESCQVNKQNDWLVRLAYEYEWTKEKNGFVLFDTFTYAEEHLPHYYSQPCFNKAHYKTFMKKLRVYLDRDFEERANEWLGGIYNVSMGTMAQYTPDYTPGDELMTEFKDMFPDLSPRCHVKVFWVSEYGGEYGRPHYHALFFVTYPINPYKFREYVRKAWIYGFTDKRNIEEMVINGWAGIAYVSKYVTKKQELIQDILKNQEACEAMRQSYRLMFEKDLYEESLIHASEENFRKVMRDLQLDESLPFIRISRGLGLQGLEKITEHEWIRNECRIPDKRKQYKIVPIPEYFKRKHMYDYDCLTKTWRINDKGKMLKAQWAKDRQSRNIINIQNVLYHYIDLPECRNLFTVKYVKEVRDKVMAKGIKRFANILATREMAATDFVRNNYHNWDEVIQDIIANPMYRIDPQYDELNGESQTIAYTIGRAMKMEDILPKQEAYLLKCYDQIVNEVNKQRAKYMRQKAIEAERQKKIKNNLKPNVT